MSVIVLDSTVPPTVEELQAENLMLKKALIDLRVRMDLQSTMLQQYLLSNNQSL